MERLSCHRPAVWLLLFLLLFMSSATYAEKALQVDNYTSMDYDYPAGPVTAQSDPGAWTHFEGTGCVEVYKLALHIYEDAPRPNSYSLYLVDDWGEYHAIFDHCYYDQPYTALYDKDGNWIDASEGYCFGLGPSDKAVVYLNMADTSNPIIYVGFKNTTDVDAYKIDIEDDQPINYYFNFWIENDVVPACTRFISIILWGNTLADGDYDLDGSDGYVDALWYQTTSDEYQPADEPMMAPKHGPKREPEIPYIIYHISCDPNIEIVSIHDLYGNEYEAELVEEGTRNIYFVSMSGMNIQEGDNDIEIKTRFRDKTQPIDFADSQVKKLCVANWDLNGDGELSRAEAKMVYDLGTVFKSSTITKFDELSYFTGITYIPNNAFYCCKKLTSVVLPENVEIINKNAFYACTNLRHIGWPYDLRSIGEKAFYYCKKLSTLNLPMWVTRIGERAFGSCPALQTVNLGQSSMGDYAFNSSTALTSVTVRRENPAQIASNVFPAAAYTNATLYTPASLKDKYQQNAVWSKFKKLGTLSSEKIVDLEDGYVVAGETLDLRMYALPYGSIKGFEADITLSDGLKPKALTSEDPVFKYTLVEKASTAGGRSYRLTVTPKNGTFSTFGYYVDAGGFWRTLFPTIQLVAGNSDTGTETAQLTNVKLINYNGTNGTTDADGGSAIIKVTGTVPEEFELVDLGLSVKWADRNLDSDSESGYGSYYAWGESSPKAKYTWGNYEYASGSAKTAEFIGTDISQTDYDAAFLTDNGLSMPTAEQWNELVSKCTWKAETSNGVKGYRVTGPSGKSIFLPLSGCSYEGKKVGVGASTYYWTSANSTTSYKAKAFYLESGASPVQATIQRRTGAVIRPVMADVKYVDLGLSSGQLWAKCNVGASSPEQTGTRYAWGETAAKGNYYWKNYLYASGSAATVKDIGQSISGNSQYDPATGKEVTVKSATYASRMPGKADFEELLSECSTKAETLNGVNGIRFTGSNGNSIFLPFTGAYYDGSNHGAGTYTYYWSGDLNSASKKQAHSLYCKDGEVKLSLCQRRTGLPIRAIYTKKSANSDFAIFDTDGIEAVKRAPAADDAVYTIQGIKVEGPLTPGVYVRNGKKFIVK